MYHELVERMIDSIVLSNPDIEREVCSHFVHYKLATLASNMRVKIQYKEEQDPAPINHYALVLLPSGAGKNSSLNLLDSLYFREAYNRLNKVFWHYYNEYLKELQAEGKTEDEIESIKSTLAVWSPSVGDATPSAMLQMVQTMFLIKFGTGSFEIDELDKALTSKGEMIDNLYGAYDNGIWQPKALKSEKMKGLVYGVAPNMFAFCTYEALMLEDNVAEIMKSKLQSGLARRMFFYHEDKDRLPREMTALEMLELEEKAKANKASGADVSQKLLSMINPNNLGKVMKMTKEAKIRMYEFEIEGKNLAKTNRDPIMVADYKGRPFKTVKMAGLYAFIEGKDEVDVEHIEHAIRYTEESSESLKRMVQGKSKLEKLYLRIRNAGRFIDSNEALEYGYFDRKGTTAIKSRMKELEDISLKYGDAYECMEIGSLVSVKIRQLITTDPESCILSVSMPVKGKPNHADGYKKYELPFDEIHNWITQDNVCYAGTAFTGGNRNLSSTEQLTNLIILDVDDGMSIEYAKEVFSDSYCIIAPTRNHRKVKTTSAGVSKPAVDRFRIILLADKYLETSNDTYKELMKNIARYYGITADTQCYDKSHIYYGNSTEDVWIGGCKEKFKVAKLIPKEKDKSHVVKTFIPSGGGALKAWFEQEAHKAGREGTGGVNLLHKAGQATKDAMQFADVNEAEEWLISLHDIIENECPTYWTTNHNFKSEVLNGFRKKWE